MSDAIASCPLSPKDPCDEIAKRIDDLINRNKREMGDVDDNTHGLKYRFPEQINGENGPGTKSWVDHEEKIKQQQTNLKRELNKYDDNGCGPPPPGSWSWATRPVPAPSEWRGGQESSTVNAAEKGVAGVGVGYLIYRGVRMIPSLFPALWWTAPENLAIP